MSRNDRGLSLRSVSKRFDGRVVALERVDLDAEAGERLAIVGPSAAGKSTLLRLVAGVERADAGTISIDGRDLGPVPAWRRPVRILLQDPALVPFWPVGRNVTFGGRPTVTDRRLIEQLGLSGLVDRRPGTLSGGQRQRVALARALRGNPRVLLLDEPFARLDPPARLELRTLVTELTAQRPITTVLVTHDATEAMAFGHRLAVLIRGRIAQIGSPLEVYERPRTVDVAALLGDPPMNLIAVPPGIAAPAGAVTMGARAERLHLRRPGSAPSMMSWMGRIVHEEPRGDVNLVRVLGSNRAVWVRRPRGDAERDGDWLVVVDPRDVVWFDREGRRIDP